MMNRHKLPVVNCISNIVTVNDCANIMLAAGFSPIMADEPLEMEEIAQAADACVINLGTPSERKYEAAAIAGAAYNRLGKPVVIDPVGVAVSSYRLDRLRSLLEKIHPDVIRCNLNEARAVCALAEQLNAVSTGSGSDKPMIDETIPEKPESGIDALSVNRWNRHEMKEDGYCTTAVSAGTQYIKESNGDENSCGVDSRESREAGLAEGPAIAARLARSLDCVVLISGAADIVSDGEHVTVIEGGSDRLKEITGSGCMLSVLTGGFCARAVMKAGNDAVSRMTEDGNKGTCSDLREHMTPGNGEITDGKNDITGKKTAKKELLYRAVCDASRGYKRIAEAAESGLSDGGGTGELRMRLIDAAAMLRIDQS